MVGVAEGAYMGVIPVLPRFVDKFALSEFEAGVLVAAGGVTMALASPPAGVLADRFGARRTTVCAAAVLVAPTLAQPFAPTFTTLLVLRVAIGVGLALAWVGATAWLAENAPEARVASWLGGVVTWASVGIALSPPITGLMVDIAGFASPFVATAAILALLAGTLAWLPVPRTRAAPPRAARASRAALRTRQIAVSVAVLSIGGISITAAGVLVPLGLDGHGFSALEIGLVFGLSAFLFTACSLWVTRRGDAFATTRTALLGCSALALSFVPAAASQKPLPVIVMMLLSSPARAVVSTISLPLALKGAHSTGLSAGAAMGLMNAVWAISTVIGPLYAGAVSEAFGLSAAYVLLLALILATASVVAIGAREARPRPPAAGKVHAG